MPNLNTDAIFSWLFDFSKFEIKHKTILIVKTDALNSTFEGINSNYEKCKPDRRNWIPHSDSVSRNSLTELNGKENALSLVSYISLKMATLAYLFMVNLKLWKN